MPTLPCGHDASEAGTGVQGGKPSRCKACRRESYQNRPRRLKNADQFYRQLWKQTEVNPRSGCFVFTGYVLPNGYAQIWMPGPSEERRKEYIHRIAWIKFAGPIPDGLDIDHVADRGCISRACWNIAHLEPVTRAVNIQRTKKLKET